VKYTEYNFHIILLKSKVCTLQTKVCAARSEQFSDMQQGNHGVMDTEEEMEEDEEMASMREEAGLSREQWREAVLEARYAPTTGLSLCCRED